MMWGSEIEQWIEDNRTLIDSEDFKAITLKFDSDCTDKLICSFEAQDRFYAILGYLTNKSFIIAPEMGIEIDLYVDYGDGVNKYQVYTAPDIKNYDKINSLEDSKLKEFVARTFSQDRNIPLEMARAMVANAKIDRSNA